MNKSAFARKILESDPTVTAKVAISLWVKDGNPSDERTLLRFRHSFNNIKTQWNKERRAGLVKIPVNKIIFPDDKTATYDKIESELDKVVQSALLLNDKDLAQQLRQARRIVSARLV